MSFDSDSDDLWTYRARVEDIVDGDTLDVTVDLGFRMTREIRLRLDGVDTAETYGVDHDSSEYAEGVRHTNFVEAWVESVSAQWDGEYPVIVRTGETGKYGRYMATVEARCDGFGELATDLVSRYPSVATDEYDG